MQKTQTYSWRLLLLLSFSILFSCDDNTNQEHFNDSSEPAFNITEDLLTSGPGRWTLNEIFNLAGDYIIPMECQYDDYLYFSMSGTYIIESGITHCSQQESEYLYEGSWNLLSNERIHMIRIDSQGNHVEEEGMLQLDANTTLLIKGSEGIKIYSKVE